MFILSLAIFKEILVAGDVSAMLAARDVSARLAARMQSFHVPFKDGLQLTGATQRACEVSEEVARADC